MFSLLFALLLLALSIHGFFGGWHWTGELVTPFRLQYTLGAAVLLLWSLLRRHRGEVRAMALLTLVINAWVFLPFYQGSPPSSPTAQAAPADKAGSLTLLQLNLYVRNWNHRRVLDFIAQRDADLVTLVEVSPHWQQALRQDETLKRRYPYRFTTYANELAILSRYPLSGRRVAMDRPDAYVDSYLVTRVKTPGQPLTLVLIHPRHPTTPHRYERQRAMVAHLVAESPRLPRPLIVAGDMNTTPWSDAFLQMKSGLGLQDSLYGFGLQPTFPTYFPPVLMIPIDHVMTSPEVRVLARETGPTVGSDHQPVWVRFRWPARLDGPRS